MARKQIYELMMFLLSAIKGEVNIESIDFSVACMANTSSDQTTRSTPSVFLAWFIMSSSYPASLNTKKPNTSEFPMWMDVVCMPLIDATFFARTCMSPSRM